MEQTFEESFAAVEQSAAAALKTTAGLLAQIKALQRAARDGDIRKMRRLTATVADAADAVSSDVLAAMAAWPFDEKGEEEYLDGPYYGELEETARGEGLALYQRDGQIVCSPSIVRVSGADRSARIDRTRVTAIRPSALVATLRKHQAKPQRFRPEQFIEVLYETYRMLTDIPRHVGRIPSLQFNSAPTVPLERVYAALTRLPGANRDYDRSEFTRDVYLLDASSVVETRSGARLSLPASTGTRTGGLAFVTRDGELVTYYGVSFTKEP